MSIKVTHKKVWQTVNVLAFMKNRSRLLPSKLITSNSYTVSDEETIAEEFNNYFNVNIRKTMANALTSGSACNLNFTATNKNSNSLFLMPSYPQEVITIIKKLKTKKAERRRNGVS